MGWVSVGEPGHEGHMVGVVAVGYGWRELDTRDDESRSVQVVQVGCDCGWRSPRMTAPDRTMWHPYMIELPGAFEERAIALWDEHVRQVVAQRRAGEPGPAAWLTGVRDPVS